MENQCLGMFLYFDLSFCTFGILFRAIGMLLMFELQKGLVSTFWFVIMIWIFGCGTFNKSHSCAPAVF